MNTEPIKIVVADDHSLFRQGIITIINSVNGLEVVGEAENGRVLLGLLKSVKPDVILMDIQMPELGGIEATELVKSRYPKIKIIALTMFDEDEFIIKMIKSGVNGYLFKASTIEQVEETIKKVCLYGSYFEEKHQNLLVSAHTRKASHIASPGIEYTRKELEILTLLSKGLTSKEIAELIGLSNRSVEGYRSALLKRTNSKTVGELVSYAIGHSLIGV